MKLSETASATDLSDAQTQKSKRNRKDTVVTINPLEQDNNQPIHDFYCSLATTVSPPGAVPDAFWLLLGGDFEPSADAAGVAAFGDRVSFF